MATATYLLGIGSNRRGRHGAPPDEVRAAVALLAGEAGTLLAASPVVATAPLGPSIRAFANAGAAIASDEPPPALLVRLKRLEAAFGRRRGRRWGARVIDLDILWWSGGRWASPGLVIPHREAARRGFVLAPLLTIVPDWRDPASGRSLRQLHGRLTARRPVA